VSPPGLANDPGMESGPSEIAVLRWLAAVGTIVTALSVGYIAHYDFGFPGRRFAPGRNWRRNYRAASGDRVFRPETSEAKMIEQGGPDLEPTLIAPARLYETAGESAGCGPMCRSIGANALGGFPRHRAERSSARGAHGRAYMTRDLKCQGFLFSLALWH
jgi:hypothetical protein